MERERGTVAKPDVVVQALDGHSTIGGTKILVGWEGEGAFLDFGINYATWGRYFEEYVKPRSARGMGDLWQLGMVPQVQGLYRPDVVPPGLKAGQPLPVKRISGVFLSHAHLDHAGLIGLLDPNLPLVTSRTSAAILKATQDTSKTELWSSPCYVNQYKVARVGRNEVLKSDTSKPAIGRPLHLTDGAGPNGFSRFWGSFPWADGSGRGKELLAGDVAPYAAQSGFAAKAHIVDHSVLGGSAFVLESPNGPIVYSGDLRAQGKHAGETTRFLEGLVRHKPYILLMEGTQVRPAEDRDPAMHEPRTEDGIRAFAQRTVDDYAGQLVLADFAPRNIERLVNFLDIARRSGRRLVVFPKDAYLLHAMHEADPSVPVPGGDLVIYDPPGATQDKWETWLLDSQYPHAHVTAAEIRRAPAEFLLCFSYFDLKHLLDLEPKGGAYIYSNSEAHSEEQEIDFERLRNWLVFFGLTPLGFHFEDHPLKPGKKKIVFDGGYHCSGHMPGDEILDWIVKIQPENLVPVHTTHYDGFAKAVAKSTNVKIHPGGMVR